MMTEKILAENIQLAYSVYQKFSKKVQEGRSLLKRPLTYAEKILFAHLTEDLKNVPQRKKSYAFFAPDRVAMQDATAQMALLQFIQSGRKKVAVPTSVHCDHLIVAREGSQPDLQRALKENQEVYQFLRSVAIKYGMDFWGPNSGIIHQIILENYGIPGGMIIGTDSHTPNVGGLGMMGIGVGGADAVDAMAKIPWELQWPGVIGVHLKGKLQGWATPKDVILYLLRVLTVKGGTGSIIEYFGEGTNSLSCTGKATITNMGAELGATSSIFPYDDQMAAYLRATGRENIAKLADSMRDCLGPDPEVLQSPEDYYDRVIEIDLDHLEPMVAGPATPDRVRPISQFAEECLREGWDPQLRVGLIGSCTNSSYEDLSRVAEILAFAHQNGLQLTSHLYISPGSERIRQTIARDGILSTFEKTGVKIFANACGPCIGQWERTDFCEDKPNNIITSFNRNFQGRADGNPKTRIFIASPELVTVLALAGKINFDPSKDPIIQSGKVVHLPPPKGKKLPPAGFVVDISGYEPPADDPDLITISVDPQSERIQLLEPFSPWDGNDFENLWVLVKVKGKCTTDHISPAGSWLKYRGHLANISKNLLLGATNAFTGEIGHGTNPLTGAKHQSFAEIAQALSSPGWVIIGDENYGEGSSREHAAMEPRYLGCKAVIVRSFARIHETNLKKQGILPLWFENPQDYEKIQEGDRISLLGIRNLAPGSQVIAKIHHQNNQEETILLRHTMSEQQIRWFQDGSALNTVRKSLEVKLSS